MPIHDLGYRGWTGKRSSENLRWFVIAETGIRLAWQSRWVRRMMFAAWLPCLYFAAALFFFEQSMRQPTQVRQGVQQIQRIQKEFQEAERRNNPNRRRARRPSISSVRFMGFFSDSRLILDADPNDPPAYRHAVWTSLLFYLSRYPQGLLMVLMVGMITPPLISRDFRSRAFLVYFARPLSTFEYALGKGLVIATYIFLITVLPAVVILIFGVLLSPSVDVIFSVWDILLRIILSSALLIVPTTVISLCLSSMCEDSRYAGFTWFAAWILGGVTYVILFFIAFASPSAKANAPFLFSEYNPLALISPYNTLGAVQRWIFGIDPKFANVVPHLSLLVIMTLGAAYILMRRISKPMNI